MTASVSLLPAAEAEDVSAGQVVNSLRESVRETAGDDTLDVDVSIEQVSETTLTIDTARTEDVRAALEDDVCGEGSEAGGCSVRAVTRRRNRLRSLAEAQVLFEIIRVLAESDTLTAPVISAASIADAAGTAVAIAAPPAVTRMEASVSTTVVGDSDAARRLESSLDLELASAASSSTGVGTADEFTVSVAVTMPPWPPPAPITTPQSPPGLLDGDTESAVSSGAVPAGAWVGVALGLAIVALIGVVLALKFSPLSRGKGRQRGKSSEALNSNARAGYGYQSGIQARCSAPEHKAERGGPTWVRRLSAKLSRGSDTAGAPSGSSTQGPPGPSTVKHMLSLQEASDPGLASKSSKRGSLNSHQSSRSSLFAAEI